MIITSLQRSILKTQRLVHQTIRSCKQGVQSESEQWRRVAAYWADKELNAKQSNSLPENESIKGYESGRLSTFEDEEGNPLYPTGTLTYSRPLKPHKHRSLLIRRSNFIDEKRVKFKAGDGGDGRISFLKLFVNPLGGPDGGDGGNGGHIILKVNSQVKSLANIQSLYRGNNGEDGGNKDLTGKSGDHLIIEVPCGTMVKNENGQIQVELMRDGEMYIVARGGAGGKGNHFYLSNENRHPRVAELGGRGEYKLLFLEMRCFAHAGLIGFPNVGKSTLLRAISRAKPKVANYPFTTLQPYVGVVQYDDYEQIAVADLPGLIEGAHLDKGLGLSFLKHVERCVCLFYVIDIQEKEPWKQLVALKFELERYKTGLSKRPSAIIAAKYDSFGLDDNVQQLKDYITKTTPEGEIPLPVIPLSAKFGVNLIEFLQHLRALYDLYNKPEEDEEGFKW